MADHAKPADPLATSVHALVIEDEPLIAMLIEDTLIEAGATSIAVAHSEEEAIESARRCHPDFITSDVHLAPGNGPAAVQAIYREQGMVPTVFITALPDNATPCAPFAVVLTKPFQSARIIELFHLLTRSR